MSPPDSHSAEVTITNTMGFHVRPVQRFAELARSFQCDVVVTVRDRSAPGKSVMNLMGLGARLGDRMCITATGDDARQCVSVLQYLASSNFFVEDDLAGKAEPLRHLDRLASIASCFGADIRVTVDGASADAKDRRALSEIGLGPVCRAEFDATGPDAPQALAVLEHLLERCFYMEDMMASRSRKEA